VRPTIGAMVRHWVGISLARCSSFSSSSRVHSVFLMAGSSHSYHRALHCLADLRTSREEMRDHWFSPYLPGRSSRGSRGLVEMLVLVLARWRRRRGGGGQGGGGRQTLNSLPGAHFITAALRISSSVFFHTPPLMRTAGGAEMGQIRAGGERMVPRSSRHTSMRP